MGHVPGNHAGAVLACDFFIVVTATFQRLYVFVVLDIGTRRVVHWNLTDHPTAEWTIQQFRDGLPLDGAYRFLVHDRDAIFALAVDEAIRSMSLQVLKTPVRAPQANAYCERFIGTARRECLDWMIPLNERHLRSILAEWREFLRSTSAGTAIQQAAGHVDLATTQRYMHLQTGAVEAIALLDGEMTGTLTAQTGETRQDVQIP